MDPRDVVELTELLMMNGVKYGFGKKIRPLSKALGIKEVDCSGFTRWAVFGASGVTIPNGSVQQHEWAKKEGFKVSTVESGNLNDNAIRIAFLDPSKSLSKIGHVVLIINGKTCESHGSKGPNMRVWKDLPWAHLCDVYVLTPPRP
jgi:hypothetical protein